MSKGNKDPAPFVVKENAGQALGSSSGKPLGKRFDDLDNLVKAVLIVLLVMVATMILTTTNMYLDQAHYNSEFYDNYNNTQGTVQKQLNSDASKITQLQGEVKKLKPGG